MKLFSQLIQQCIQEPKTSSKIKLLSTYFNEESVSNIPFALHFLIGENFGRFCSAKLLRQWCAQHLHYPEWLVDESYEALGDNSETIALCFSKQTSHRNWELHQLCEQINLHKKSNVIEKKEFILAVWNDLSSDYIYIFNKLMGGGLRIGASKKNVLKALSAAKDIPLDVIEQRILTNWQPTSKCFLELISKKNMTGKGLSPYPFFLASPIHDPLDQVIKNLSNWIIEPKWDGIRAQLICRPQGCALWSRGNELISGQFPELLTAASNCPYGVYDGEILAWKNDFPLPFYQLQQRLNRKNITTAMIKKIPVVMKIYDCLEANQQDIRCQTIKDRRECLTHLKPPFYKSNALTFANKVELQHYVSKARDNGIEGVILKKISSSYKSGRIRGDWWKLKVDPLSLDVVIMYAQKGKGIRSGLFTDYTFGVWNEEQLVPVGKAYSGLTHQDIKKLSMVFFL